MQDIHLYPNVFFDIINIAFVLAILFYCRKKYIIEDGPFFILIGHFVLIFLTNYVLFNPSYMYDQFKYLYNAMIKRGAITDVFYTPSGTINTAGTIFGYFPLPVINSIYSIAMINFLLYLFIYIFLRQKNVLTRFSEYFYLLYPSLALYSALALRDIIIYALMILFLYYFLIERRKILPFIFLAPLVVLKFQNAAILFVMMFIYILIDFKNLKPSTLIFIIGVIVLFFIVFNKYLNLAYINNLRYYFYFYENPDQISEYQHITSWGQLAFLSVTSFFRFILEPYIWDTENVFQIFQAVENIIIFSMLIINYIKTRSNADFGKRERRFLNIYFIFSMLIYAMVVINPGTAARYRFVFVITYFIFYPFFCNKIKNTSPITDKELYAY